MVPYDKIILKYQVKTTVTMSQRRKSRSARLNRKPIDLSEICYDSTCITLNIPQSMACLKCEPKMCIHTKRGRQQKALERLKDDRNKCDQIWLTKVATNQKCSTSKIIRHNEVRAYLGIESDVILEFNYHNNSTETKANPARNFSKPASNPTIPSTHVPPPFDIQCNPPSFLKDEPSTSKLPKSVLEAISKLSKVDYKKINTSPAILYIINTLVDELHKTRLSDEVQESERGEYSDRTLLCGTIV